MKFRVAHQPSTNQARSPYRVIVQATLRCSPEVTRWRSAKVTLAGNRIENAEWERPHPRRRRDRVGEMEGEASSSTPQACRPAAGGSGMGQGLTTEGR